MTIFSAIESELGFLTQAAPALIELLEIVDSRENFVLSQALCLTALIRHRKPDVFIDLGTGYGNSAAIAAYAFESMDSNAQIHTFDFTCYWNERTRPRLPVSLGDRVVSHQGDITAFDFGPLLRDSRSAIVFWDAHGHEIAEKVLSEVIPAIWFRPHLIICHDMSDTRFGARRSYGNSPPWRGMNHYYDVEKTNTVRLGHFESIVDQIIPILDFCSRNEVDLQSFDYDFSRQTKDFQSEFLTALQGAPFNGIHMAYFSLEGCERIEAPVPRAGDSAAFVYSKCLLSLSSDQYRKSLDRNYYGGDSSHPFQDPRIVNFKTTRDHLATRFFSLPIVSGNDRDKLDLRLRYEWSDSHIPICELLLQDGNYRFLPLVPEALSQGRQRSCAVSASSGSLLRLVFTATSPGEYLLPSKLSVEIVA